MSHQTFFKHDMSSRVQRAAEIKKAEDALRRLVYKRVDERDGRVCRCCDRRSDPEATGILTRGHRHHMIYRSAGGTDDSGNLVTLCATCHDDEHHSRLRIEGNPNTSLTFSRQDRDGEWYIVRHEIAVRQVLRD